jgi:hypothetical protein
MNQNTNKTHCVHGHAFTAENTYQKGDKRICILCRNSSARDRARAAEARYRASKKTSPEAWKKEQRRRRSLQLRRIGWTLELYEKRFEEQCGRCDVCKRPLVKFSEGAITRDQANADHEHIDPPKPRGILCNNCNVGLGNFQDDPEIMLAAIAYVRKWKEG